MTPVAEVPRGILVLFDTRLLRTRGRSASAHYIQDPKISRFQDFKISRSQDLKISRFQVSGGVCVGRLMGACLSQLSPAQSSQPSQPKLEILKS